MGNARCVGLAGHGRPVMKPGQASTLDAARIDPIASIGINAIPIDPPAALSFPKQTFYIPENAPRLGPPLVSAALSRSGARCYSGDGPASKLSQALPLFAGQKTPMLSGCFLFCFVYVWGFFLLIVLW